MGQRKSPSSPSQVKRKRSPPRSSSKRQCPPAKSQTNPPIDSPSAHAAPTTNEISEAGIAEAKGFSARFARRSRGVWREYLEEEMEKLPSGAVILDIVDICMRIGWPMPPKAASEFCERYMRYQLREVETLDEAFDGSRRKSEKERRYIELRKDVVFQVEKLHITEGRRIDASIFRKVAKELRIPGLGEAAMVSRIYYAAPEWLRLWVRQFFKNGGEIREIDQSG